MSYSRRNVLQLSVATVAATAAARFNIVQAGSPNEAHAALSVPLDRFVQTYLHGMDAPGMTLALADRAGVQRVVSYGLADKERGSPVNTAELFQIGSISKSFVALCLLQLRDEGKLDLHAPLTDYLPWLRIDSKFPRISAHHLLTHSAGLPGIPPVFLSDPSQPHRAANAPGEHFHYCNTGFELLGYLASTLDGRQLPDLLRARILEPLGMTRTEPCITLDMRPRLVQSYMSFQSDRAQAPSSRLSAAPGIIFTSGAGCIASTAQDMGAYVRMLANRGEGPKGRLVSEESFTLFSTAHIKAEEFGPTASYGYGIAVDRLDGHAVVRHTGGMVSFASALLVDLEAGVGAFASINAMQGYRPMPVVQFAAQLMRAQGAKQPLPAIPSFHTPVQIANAADYEGTYTDTAGRVTRVVREGEHLYWVRKGERVALESGPAPDRFVVQHAELAHFPLVFVRDEAKGDDKGAVTELSWGSEWYAGASYTGQRDFKHPPQWESYLGHYRNENPWIGSMRVVLRKGQLWLDGAIPLVEEGDRFMLRDEEHSPEWVRFGEIVNGRCVRIKLSGEDLWRVATT